MSGEREKAKGLIELAFDDSTTDKERISSALKACALIRKYSLLSNPLDEMLDNENVRAAKVFFDMFSDPDVKNVMKKAGQKISEKRRRR